MRRSATVDEGSGLIDIRALAATLATAATAPSAAPVRAIEPVEVVAIGGAIPVIRIGEGADPRARRAARMILSVCAVSAVGMVAFALGWRGGARAPVAAPVAIRLPPAAPEVRAAAGDPPEVALVREASEDVVDVAAPSSPSEPARAPEIDPVPGRARSGVRSRDAVRVDRSATADRPVVGPRSAPELDDGFLDPAPVPAPRAALPPTPSPREVSAAMSAIAPAVTACASGAPHGVAVVTVSVAGETGRVVRASVGSSVASAAAACIERAASRAHFPRFERTTFVVRYPFTI